MFVVSEDFQRNIVVLLLFLPIKESSWEAVDTLFRWKRMSFAAFDSVVTFVPLFRSL